MTYSRSFICSICLLAILFISSSFTSLTKDGKSKITVGDGNIECSACHASWFHGGTGTEEALLRINHSIDVSFFENYISVFTEKTVNQTGVDIKKMAEFIESL